MTCPNVLPTSTGVQLKATRLEHMSSKYVFSVFVLRPRPQQLRGSFKLWFVTKRGENGREMMIYPNVSSASAGLRFMLEYRAELDVNIWFFDLSFCTRPRWPCC